MTGTRNASEGALYLRRPHPAKPGRRLTWAAWTAAVVAAFGAGALVVMDVHATFDSPVLLGEFYGLVLAFTCVAVVVAAGALLARWATVWIRDEIAGLREEVAALRDKQAGYADGVVHGMGLANAAEPDPPNGTVSLLRQRDRSGEHRVPPA